MTRSTHAISRRRGGYVLIVTLGLLVTSTTLLVAVGRTAIQHALDARLEADRVQRDWAVRSCSATLLSHSEEILKTAEMLSQQPVPVVRQAVQLGGRRYDISVSDDQAKANVNALLERADASTVTTRLQAAFSGIGVNNNLRLRPLLRNTPATSPTVVQNLITSYGQIFDALPPEQLFPSAGGPLDRITCFGSGAINVIRATEPALRLALAPPFTDVEINRLVAARDSAWATARGSSDQNQKLADLPPIDRLLAQAKITSAGRAKLALTTASTCHSVTIVARDGRRVRYDVFVMDAANPRSPKFHSFAW